MLTANDIAQALGGHPFPAVREFIAVCQDSRLVTPGSLFIALRGETQDGHVFIRDALSRGATGLLVERVPDGMAAGSVIDLRLGGQNPGIEPEPPIVFVVENSLRALQLVAHYWRRRHVAQVVGVTGSVGKTSTKEMIAAVLGTRFCTLKNEKNLNNEIGLPLTLLQLTSRHQRAVLEMGMYDVGEIHQLCQIAEPRLGVVTNVGPSHLERLGSLDRVAQAKAELVEALPADGVAILNGDDLRVRAMASRMIGDVFTYGRQSDCDLWADDVESHGLYGISLRLHHLQESVSLRVPLLGEHSAYTVLAAAAVGLVEKLSWAEITAGLNLVPGQLRLVVAAGINGSTLVDDSYNSSPASALAALQLLSELDGSHVAVLGDMLELGAYEDEGHRLVGRRAAEVVSYLLVVGPRGRLIGVEALAKGMPTGSVSFAADNAEAIAALRARLQPGDCVLIKGSRGMKMEEIVTALRNPAADHGDVTGRKPAERAGDTLPQR
jgi:UDP-N-acetylmuramoyl-tripeptide--D-alanyl-D-alanine ligase